MKALYTGLLFFGTASAGNVAFDDEKCRALALRGGGTKGAYEVGVLRAMIEMLDPLEYAYDVVEGVSVGGLNAGLLASYEKG